MNRATELWLMSNALYGKKEPLMDKPDTFLFKLHKIIIVCPVCGNDVELDPPELLRHTSCSCGYIHNLREGLQGVFHQMYRPLKFIKYRLGDEI